MAQGTLGRLRIALTREREANAELAALLRAAGATTFEFPLIRILPPRDPAPLESALQAIDRYDWLVLTSGNAAQGVFSRVGSTGRVRIACVGEAAAAVVRAAGAEVALLPERATSKGMLEALGAAGVDGAKVLWPRSELAPPTLKEGLTALGAQVDDPIAYRNEPDHDGAAELKRLLQSDALDAIAFASASAATNALAAVGDLLAGMRVYSIGPTTSQALRQAGVKIASEAADHSARGLADVIIAGERERE